MQKTLNILSFTEPTMYILFLFNLLEEQNKKIMVIQLEIMLNIGQSMFIMNITNKKRKRNKKVDWLHEVKLNE